MPKPQKKVLKSGKTSWVANPIYKGQRLGSKSFPTQREAIEYERDALQLAKEAGGASIGKYTVADAINRYAEDVSPAKKTARAEITRLSRIADQRVGKILLRKLADSDIEDWIKAERNRLTPTGKTRAESSIARELTLLLSVLKYARKWRWMMHDPAETVYDRPSASRKRSRRFEPHELDALEASLRCTVPRYRDLAMQAWDILNFAIETGMRRSEILAVRPRHNVCKRTFVCRLPTSKNGDPREVPLSEKAMGILEGYPDGFTMTANNLSRMILDHCKRCGIEDLHFHDARHEAASRFVESGLYASPIDLMKVMGWRRMDMANTYYNPRMSDFALRMRQHQAKQLDSESPANR